MGKTKDDKLSKRFEVANLLIGLTGVLVGFFIGIYSIKSSENIAKESGAFDKPKAQLYLSNYAPRPQEKTNLYYGFAFKDSSMVIGRLPVVVKNVGGKTIENLAITFRYPKTSQRILFESMEFVSGGIYGHQDIKRDFNQLGDFEYASFQLSQLNPEQSIGLNEPLFLHETKIQDTVQVQKLAFTYEAYYALQLTITISGADIILQDYQISLQGIRSNNMGELEQRVYDFIIEEARRIRRNTSFVEYMAFLLKDNTRYAVLVYPSMDTQKTASGNIYYSSEEANDKIRIATYDLHSFHLLFQASSTK